MEITFDSRGREQLSDIPASFVVPTQRRISTLDFHRQRLLEQRELLRRMMEEMKEDSEYESFKEANDFAVEDPFDEEVSRRTDFELDDDGMDGLEAVYQRVHSETVEKASRQDMNTSTETQSPPESGS